MKPFLEHKGLVVVLTLFMIFTLACQSLSQTHPSEISESSTISPTKTESRERTNILPTLTAAKEPTKTPLALTATLESCNSLMPSSAQNTTDCPPRNVSFPFPEELENYIGWRYVHNRFACDYPQGGYSILIQMDGQDYGLTAYELKDNSFMLSLEELLCRDNAGNPAWEIIDVLRTRPLAENEDADLGTLCTKNGERTSNYPFVFMDKRNNGKVYQAWSIKKTLKTIVLVSTEGLSCFIDGAP